MKQVGELSFEEALKELEQVVGQLESGNVDLDKSIALYERGADLKRHCEAKLAQAQARIEQITLAENGQPSGTAPFDAQ
ncbi:MAG: exodeoxyribonuclease VII small subunit [Rhodobacter sp.]|uniref:exodeoxyribonuclease VII small subunit n=1 Tax=Pararhodobacter sp. TaxID=2127056 RepID=UPI001DB5EBD7|nr:exodeoxyribonuclease VII small subunit [Pararhodobacter sp.]MCB1346335.1 exodeoxyribonuclease VII small subunit [Paracoccaceae bacterium]MCC0072453.1 exodeoxyribonuclease VII small subunit [Rhodobacter sp.]HPD91283.1 exodeoxyribonuclease VII small subunit [Pararhodobacter sp.]